jgi:hypothetical protein
MIVEIELTAVTCGLLFLLALTARVRWGMFRRVTILPPAYHTTFRPLNAAERQEFEKPFQDRRRDNSPVLAALHCGMSRLRSAMPLREYAVTAMQTPSCRLPLKECGKV